MKLSLFVLVLFISLSGFANDKSKLVDVDKNSKLSDYFKKIAKPVSDGEDGDLLKQEKVEQKVEKLVQAESEIPLNISKESKKKKSSLSPLNKMVLSIFGLVAIAGLVFAALQRAGKKTGYTNVAKNINILAQKSIGPKKNLMLIQIAGETILLGVTDHNINHIKTLSLLEDELPQFTNPKFAEQFKEKIEETKITEETEVVDGFAVSKLDDVKDIVTKRFSI